MIWPFVCFVALAPSECFFAFWQTLRKDCRHVLPEYVVNEQSCRDEALPSIVLLLQQRLRSLDLAHGILVRAMSVQCFLAPVSGRCAERSSSGKYQSLLAGACLPVRGEGFAMDVTSTRAFKLLQYRPLRCLGVAETTVA